MCIVYSLIIFQTVDANERCAQHNINLHAIISVCIRRPNYLHIQSSADFHYSKGDKNTK